MEKVTDKEVTIVNRAMESHLLREICVVSGLKTKDIKCLKQGDRKNKRTEKLISGCRELLKEDLEDLQDLLQHTK